MRFFDMLGMARDNLGRSPLRTALTAIGVAIGTAAVVTLISVGSGSEAILVNQATSFGQVTTVMVDATTPPSRAQPSAFHAITPATVRAIAALPHVDEVAGWLSTPPLRLTAGARSHDLPAVGQMPITAQVTLVTRVVRDETDGVLVPDSAARQFGVAPATLVGRRIVLTAGGDVCCTGSGDSSIAVYGPDRRVAARIAGVYKASSWGEPGPLRIDNGAAPLLVATPLAARIDGALRGISGAAYLQRQGYDFLFAHTDDARQTTAVAAAIGAMRYRVYDRADLLARVHLAFAVLTGFLGAIGGIALLVAAIGIANTTIMTILERTREIGIMKALGAEPGTVRRLFLVETALVGLIGGGVGLVLAELAGLVANAAFHIWLRGQNVTDPVGNLSVISSGLVVAALVLALLVSLLAGAWPSRRAVRLQPLDALRYE